MILVIGAEAISRGAGFTSGYTVINANPASAAYTITKVELYAHVAMKDVEVATFYKTNGDTFSTRNTVLIGDIPIGYSEHVVSLGAEAGDYIGCYYTDGQISRHSFGDAWYKSGDFIPCTGQVFTPGSYTLSLGGNILSAHIAITETAEINPVVTKAAGGGGYRDMGIETELTPTYFGEGGGGWNVFTETELSPVLSLPAPEVTTDPALWIGPTSATLNGTLDSGGGIQPCDCGFEWGETDAYGETTPTEEKETGETFSQLITGLLPNTLYHFRASATGFGTSYGADRTFTTAAVAILPTVTTDPTTGRGALAATLNGTLDQDGGEDCECGFEWGMDTGYGTITSPQTKGTSETFSQALGGLFPGVTYHFRAFATNSVGTSYGADRSFATELVITRAYALARQEL